MGGDAPEGRGSADAPAEGVDAGTVRRNLLRWYDASARDLPWRRSDDPYAIWVSEVMLQQTRVDTVVPYWERWMARYPDVETLAAADRDEVLKSWEGLGYYRRARMLHRAAGVVRDRFGGDLPADAGTLRELPGVGEYTAGAIASIAFGEAVPAVDGNVRRVLSRLFDLSDPGPAELRGLAARLVDLERPGDFNQAVMELGATVCTPRSPACGSCPLASSCRARARGVQEERPRPPERRTPPVRTFVVAAVTRPGATPEDGGRGGGVRVLLVRRPEEGLLGGMWELPTERVEAWEEGGTTAAKKGRGSGDRQVSDAAVVEAGRGLLAGMGVRTREGGRTLPAVRHAYSHFVGLYRPVLLRAADPGSGTAPAGTGSGAGGTGPVARAPGGATTAGAARGVEGRRWLHLSERPAGETSGGEALGDGTLDVPLPAAQRSILDSVREALGGRSGEGSRVVSRVDPGVDPGG